MTINVVRSWMNYFSVCYSTCDVLVINNRGYWECMGRPPRSIMIPNGVDLDIFAPTVPLRLRTPRVLWTGSFFRRVEKCYDSIVLPLTERLRSQGIDGECHIVDSHYGEKRTQTEMARWFNTGTILLCASVEEGTPNPALEASGCGCTVVSTRVGNMPDLIRHGENGFLADGDLDSLEQAVHAACENYPRLAEQMQHDIQGWHWALRSKLFFDVFRAVLRPDTEEALAS